MNLMLPIKKTILVGTLIFSTQVSNAQFLMDMIDTSKSMGKSMLSLYNRFDHIRITGYIQPQFQLAQQKGAKSFNGGDFAPLSNSRFMLRRSRIRFDYIRTNKQNQASMQFAFQFDATERGVLVRDVWARILDNKFQKFAFTTGVFARPFGYELNLSSSDRESPERGRISQTLMKTERDLGAMVTLENRKKNGKLKYLKIDAGFFNGQGLTGTADFDSYKDLITRVALKPYPLTKTITVSAGASLLQGGILQNSKYRYQIDPSINKGTFSIDSSLSNINRKDPRHYRGVDAQIKIKHHWGFTEMRGEYWWGTQTASASSSETPGVLLGATDGYYIRSFNGAFFYLLQNIVNSHHQIGLKYDWYDPNTQLTGTDIGKTATAGIANIKYSTLSAGYNFYVNENLKLMLWYDWVKNENTALAGYLTDVKDNVFTCRLQFRF
jgi:hypothetical protein